MKKTPKDELNRRIRALQRRMESGETDGALIVQNADLFYFTGTVPQGYLFIPLSGGPLFFVRRNAERIRDESEVDTSYLSAASENYRNCSPAMAMRE